MDKRGRLQINSTLDQGAFNKVHALSELWDVPVSTLGGAIFNAIEADMEKFEESAKALKVKRAKNTRLEPAERREIQTLREQLAALQKQMADLLIELGGQPSRRAEEVPAPSGRIPANHTRKRV